MVRGLGPYSVLYKLYNVHNTCDENSKTMGFKMYNYKIFIFEFWYFCINYVSSTIIK